MNTKEETFIGRNSEKPYYLGNPRIKRDGIKQQWNEDQIKEYLKCSEDPVYFIEKYMKIISLDKGLIPFEMRDYQKRMVDHFHDNRFSIVLSARQTGKCCRDSTKIKIRNKKTGKVQKIAMGDFYDEMQKTLCDSKEQ